MSKEPNGFRWRSFVSMLLFLSFSISAFSGLILFLRPEGGLANWLAWSVLGIDKKQWEGVHSVSVLVLFVAALVHLLYNWKVLVAHLQLKKSRLAAWFERVGLAREFVFALILLVLIFAGTLLRWPPFSALANLRSAFKEGKYLRAIKPPHADAERLTISQICIISGISEQQALKRAEANGIQIESFSETVEAAAKRNHVSPEKLFRMFKAN